MHHAEQIIPRKKWLAAMLSIIMPGLGQAYNGDLLKGCSFFIFFAMLPLLVARPAVYLPDRYLLLGLGVALGAALACYVSAIVEAVRKAGQEGERYMLKPYNRLYFYMALWLGGVLVMGAVDGYLRHNVVEAFKIVTESMAPQVVKGDRVIADKTAYTRHPPKVGDIVIHVFPDDRSKVLIRRIVGLPGDRLTLEDGRQVEVPHGKVYVRGEISNGSTFYDSRLFGPVDLRDVVGKVRLVYFSFGPAGIRWNRVGRTF